MLPLSVSVCLIYNPPSSAPLSLHPFTAAAAHLSISPPHSEADDTLRQVVAWQQSGAVVNMKRAGADGPFTLTASSQPLRTRVTLETHQETQHIWFWSNISAGHMRTSDEHGRPVCSCSKEETMTTC